MLLTDPRTIADRRYMCIWRKFTRIWFVDRGSMSTKQSRVRFMRYRPQNVAILGREIRHTKYKYVCIYLPLADNKLIIVVHFFKHPCGSCSHETCNLVVNIMMYGSV